MQFLGWKKQDTKAWGTGSLVQGTLKHSLNLFFIALEKVTDVRRKEKRCGPVSHWPSWMAGSLLKALIASYPVKASRTCLHGSPQGIAKVLEHSPIHSYPRVFVHPPHEMTFISMKLPFMGKTKFFVKVRQMTIYVMEMFFVTKSSVSLTNADQFCLCFWKANKFHFLKTNREKSLSLFSKSTVSYNIYWWNPHCEFSSTYILVHSFTNKFESFMGLVSSLLLLLKNILWYSC